MTKLKNSCEGIDAPEGWKFQDCKDDFISMLRQKKEKWTENDWYNRKPKDFYILTMLYDDPDEWEIHLYDPEDLTFGDYTSGDEQPDKESAVKETVCMAWFNDTWEDMKSQGYQLDFVRREAERSANICRSNLNLLDI